MTSASGFESDAIHERREDLNQRGIPAALIAEVATADPNNGGESRSCAKRPTGDEVNRFLVCSLVMKSAEHIKSRAEDGDDRVPMTMIVRGVLRAYRQAATEDARVFMGPELNFNGLKKLNAKVLRDEVMRHRQQALKTSRERLAHANRLGDEMRIQVETSKLERALAAYERTPVR